MIKIAYCLFSYEDLPNDVLDYIGDIEKDFTNKKDYFNYAKYLTNLVNKNFSSNYKWYDLFPFPYDVGRRYCTYCKCYFWFNSDCECFYLK